MKDFALLLLSTFVISFAHCSPVAPLDELPEKAKAMERKRDQYVAEGDLGSALKTALELNAIVKSGYGESDLRTADAAVRVGMILEMLERHEEALDWYLPACPLFSLRAEPTDPRPGLCLHTLSFNLLRLKRTAEARPVYEEALARLSKSLAPPRFGAATYALAERLEESGDRAEAIRYFINAGQILIGLSEKDNGYAGSAFSEAARLSKDSGDVDGWSNALTLALKAAALDAQPDKGRMVSLKFALVDALMAAGEFDRALVLVREVQGALANVRSSGHSGPEVLWSRIIQLQVGVGALDEALNSYKEATLSTGAKPSTSSIEEQVHLSLAVVDAAEVVLEYVHSRALMEEVLRQEDKLFGRWKSATTERAALAQFIPDISQRIAVYQINRGEFAAARRVLDTALARSREIFGRRSMEVASVLFRMGGLALAQQDKQSALSFLDNAVRLAVANGEIESQYRMLFALSDAQYSVGMIDQAKRSAAQALLAQEKAEGLTPELVGRRAELLRREGGDAKVVRLLTELAMQGAPTSSTMRDRLANLYEEAADYPKALELAEAALRLRTARYDEKHINIAASHYNLGRLHLKMGNKKNAQDEFLEAGKIFSEAIRRLEDELSLSELRLTLPGMVGSWRSAIISMAVDELNPGAVYDLVIPWKGQITEVLRRQVKRAEAALVHNDGAKIARLAAVRVRIVMWMQRQNRTDESRWLATMRKLVLEKESLERSLNDVGGVAGLSTSVPVPVPSAKTIAVQLKPGEVFVDVYKFSNSLSDAEDRDEYAAFLVRPLGDVQLIRLGSARVIDTAIAQWRDARGQVSPTRWRFLRNMVWNPIQSQIGQVDVRITISPDSHLATIPLQLLADNLTDNEIERGAWPVSIFQVNSAHDMVRTVTHRDADQASKRMALVVGGVDYGPPATASHPEGECWGGLAETKKEAIEISSLARRHGYASSPLLGMRASKSELLSLLSKASVAHIATHGYFSSGLFKETSGCTFRQKGAGSTSDAAPAQADLVHRTAFFRSGLVLSGANHGVSNRMSNYLTADDFIGAHINDLRLLVLSACDTGLGENDPGQGVLGLRTAVLTSGIDHLLMSLWKVPDAATQKLMVEFYAALWGKKISPAAALLQAQIKLRKLPNAKPEDWAGWIVVGRE